VLPANQKEKRKEEKKSARKKVFDVYTYRKFKFAGYYYDVEIFKYTQKKSS
jgi:hypothetical protein